MRDTFVLIQDIYKIDPAERRIGFVHRPVHRKGAPTNVVPNEAYTGIAGRMNETPLPIRDSKGKATFYPPPHLLFSIDIVGSMSVEFRPFVYTTDHARRQAFSSALHESLALISPYLAMHHISHNSAWNFLDLPTAFKTESLEEFGLTLSSPSHHFPVTIDRGLWDLQRAFIAMYPLFDTLLCISKGLDHQLPTMLESLRDWLCQEDDKQDDIEEGTIQPINLPDLESYTFVRAGLWWDILARDKWKCRSCGRTAKDHGVTLHVDHITPRSLGGKDEPANLQTLCEKCNIGKSNRDSTDLSKMD